MGTLENEQKTAIGSYIASIERSAMPKSRRTAERIEQEMTTATETIRTTMDPIRRLEATQALIDLNRELETRTENERLANPENFVDDFVDHLAGYMERTGVTCAALMRVGVPRATLRKAGVL